MLLNQSFLQLEKKKTPPTRWTHAQNDRSTENTITHGRAGTDACNSSFFVSKERENRKEKKARDNHQEKRGLALVIRSFHPKKQKSDAHSNEGQKKRRTEQNHRMRGRKTATEE